MSVSAIVFLILFFSSLGGITFLVGRKLAALSRQGLLKAEHVPFRLPRIDDIGVRLLKIFKGLGYFLLVETIRFYVKFSLILKNKYAELQTKFQQFRERNASPNSTPKEPNKFLRAMAEYKHKLGEIKREIKEEENLL